MKYLTIIENMANDLTFNGYDLNTIWVIMVILVISCFFIKYYYLDKKPVYLEHRKLEGWTGSEPFYRVHCKKHGDYETYPQGWEKEFRCPNCISEKVEYVNEYIKKVKEKENES